MPNFDGLGTILWLGCVTFLALFLTVPPGILAGLYWLLQPHVGWTILVTYVWITLLIAWGTFCAFEFFTTFWKNCR